MIQQLRKMVGDGGSVIVNEEMLRLNHVERNKEECRRMTRKRVERKTVVAYVGDGYFG